MAAVNDLIKQISDKALRERLKEEVERLTREKKFGLVFEEHLPEITPLYNVKVRKGCNVASRNGSMSDFWRVLSVEDGKARCQNIAGSEKRDIPIDDLVVVSKLGEPIFPALKPVDKVQNGSEDGPWHTLIEADNYHALQLLEYLYAGQVDCIYIDPPYNTGAKDWKYNNDYVDGNDSWRHSKWLAMMKKRLQLSKKLLHPTKGVLIVTIDEHEFHHLRMLLSQIFPSCFIQIITAVTNPKGVTQGRFSRVEEYIIYCFNADAYVHPGTDNLLNQPEPGRKPRWKGLLRSGTNARRIDRKNMFYPVLIDEQTNKVVGTGDPLPFDQKPNLDEKIDGYTAAWPIRTDRSYGNWGVGFKTLQNLISLGYVACGKYDPKRRTYGISYISQPNQKQIENGNIVITGRNQVTNVVSIEYVGESNRTIKTVWHRTRHDAGAYGSDLVRNILGSSGLFSFPKSIYSVKDSIYSVLRYNKSAFIIDFFAGSGTTLNAINLINIIDGGNRRCILVTNNEVSAEEEIQLKKEELKHGDPDWEKHGICQSVTWPRSKYTILGKRDDGSELEGEYFTGRTVEKEKSRSFHQIGFISYSELNTAARKKQLVALIEDIPQSAIKKDSIFVVSEKYPASILFDETQADAWLESLADQDHINNFYIVCSSNKRFQEIKDMVNDLLGPMIVSEEEKRPMREGFPANLEYFRLEFLEKDNVALGRQFPEILPLLWLRAGALGPRPELPKNQPIPSMILPEKNHFAVLVNENFFAKFLDAINDRQDLSHVFLVTDSEEAFQEMVSQISTPNVIQLYRDYLENFAINKGVSA